MFQLSSMVLNNVLSRAANQGSEIQLHDEFCHQQ